MKTLLTLLCLTSTLCCAQQNSPQDMKGMNMPSHDMSKMSGQAPAEDADASAHAMQSMEGHHMDMGPHMKMTALRAPQPGDAEKAQQVVVVAREVMEKYKDYHVALNEGFTIFHPEVPQKQYHFTNYGNAFEAAAKFNPEHPTSLLYEKNKDGEGYRLVGLMYTAPKRFTEDDLNQRIPLSIAQWHEHVNFCRAPEGKQDTLAPHPRFGLRGSIVTKEECDANGGEFHPIIFNWMVHLYPLEKDPSLIWSVDRQHAD
jgi:hypothetical protein